MSEQSVPTEDGAPADVCELITQKRGTPFVLQYSINYVRAYLGHFTKDTQIDAQ